MRLLIKLKVDLELIIETSKVTIITSLKIVVLILLDLVFLNIVALIIVDNLYIVFNALLALLFIFSLFFKRLIYIIINTFIKIKKSLLNVIYYKVAYINNLD